MNVISFDIGGSTVRAGLVAVDEADAGSGSVVERRHRLLDPEDKTPAALIERIVSLAVELAGVESAAEVALPLGIGFPGQLSLEGGRVVNAPNLGWRDEPLGAVLADRLPRARPRVENDLSVILLGEQRFGVARGCRHVVAVYPGTGIGGAAIVDGRLVRGAGGFAGEIGHIGMGTGIACGCGQVGCAETIAGGRYIDARIAEARERGELDESFYVDGEAIRIPEIDAAFEAGEPFAQSLWAEVLDLLSGLGATACALLNPEMVVLGGGVMTHAPNLREALRVAIVNRTPAVARVGLRVEQGELGSDAGLLGGAALALASIAG